MRRVVRAACMAAARAMGVAWARGFRPLFLSVLLLAEAAAAAAQRPVTLAQAVDAALARASGVGLARADSAAAHGALRTARVLPNPLAAAEYTEDAPQYHFTLEQAVDYPWLRSPRIGAAASTARASGLRLALARAEARRDVVVAYFEAAGALGALALARESVASADELARIAERRFEEGDASELEARLARIAAGQERNRLLADSLAALDGLTQLQLLMGLAGDSVSITPADSLVLPEPPPPGGSESAADTASPAAAPAALEGRPLAVAAALLDVRANERTLALARRSWFPPLAVTVGAERERGVPDGKLLPVVGVTLPLPLWDRNGGEVERAAAELDRARTALETARREAAAARASAARRLAAALDQAARDSVLLADARTVAAMAGTAYEEGAFSLVEVLDARTRVRDVNRLYIEDIVAARTANAELALATTDAGLR